MKLRNQLDDEKSMKGRKVKRGESSSGCCLRCMCLVCARCIQRVSAKFEKISFLLSPQRPVYEHISSTSSSDYVGRN